MSKRRTQNTSNACSPPPLTRRALRSGGKTAEPRDGAPWRHAADLQRTNPRREPRASVFVAASPKPLIPEVTAMNTPTSADSEEDHRPPVPPSANGSPRAETGGDTISPRKRGEPAEEKPPAVTSPGPTNQDEGEGSESERSVEGVRGGGEEEEEEEEEEETGVAKRGPRVPRAPTQAGGPPARKRRRMGMGGPRERKSRSLEEEEEEEEEEGEGGVAAHGGGGGGDDGAAPGAGEGTTPPPPSLEEEEKVEEEVEKKEEEGEEPRSGVGGEAPGEERGAGERSVGRGEGGVEEEKEKGGEERGGEGEVHRPPGPAEGGGSESGRVAVATAALEPDPAAAPLLPPGPPRAGVGHAPDPIGPGCPDDVSDSQLNDITLNEEEEAEEDAGCYADATALVCGLISELSSLNRTVMAAHRELESLRRARAPLLPPPRRGFARHTRHSEI